LRLPIGLSGTKKHRETPHTPIAGISCPCFGPSSTHLHKIRSQFRVATLGVARIIGTVGRAPTCEGVLQVMIAIRQRVEHGAAQSAFLGLPELLVRMTAEQHNVSKSRVPTLTVCCFYGRLLPQ
ncbi:MAG: hypothetical protein N3G20_06645, partial [Verrucomicrobiae bacterium]|nr:hypothetical protein [Verrucomicrobiae bacterium]